MEQDKKIGICKGCGTPLLEDDEIKCMRCRIQDYIEAYVTANKPVATIYEFPTGKVLNKKYVKK